MIDLESIANKKPGRRRAANKMPDLSARDRVETPTGALLVGVKSSTQIDPPRPRKRHTYLLMDPSDQRRYSKAAGMTPAAFSDFIDQVELAVFEWQSARLNENIYLDGQVQKILRSIAGSLKLLDKHRRFSLDDQPKDQAAVLLRQHQREQQALQPILELICPGWSDRPQQDFRRALAAIKATSTIGEMGPKHQSKPHVVAAAQRIVRAWEKYSKIRLSRGSSENSPHAYMTRLLSEVRIYEPYGLIEGRPKRIPRDVVAVFQEQVVNRELGLTIDRIRDRVG